MGTFSASLALENDQRDQLLLASQNYGTFYCIYAQFEVEKNILKSINFNIINYKGLINLGFLANDEPSTDGFPNSNNSKIYVFDEGETLFIGIPVKGGTCNKETFFESKNIYGSKEIDITNITKVIVFRGLVKNGAKEQDEMFFDSEFVYRDGIGDNVLEIVENTRQISSSDDIPKVTIKGLFLNETEWKNNTEQRISNFKENPENPFRAAGNNCRESELKVLKE